MQATKGATSCTTPLPANLMYIGNHLPACMSCTNPKNLDAKLIDWSSLGASEDVHSSTDYAVAARPAGAGPNPVRFQSQMHR
jgi:hypothetical protein